jgi:hypothetical protein
MKHTMDSTYQKRSEAWTVPGYGPSVWLLPGGGQFYTKSCTRCARLLPNAWRHDLKDDRERDSEIERCVHCGELLDSMTLPHRNKSNSTNDSVLSVRNQHDPCTPRARVRMSRRPSVGYEGRGNRFIQAGRSRKRATVEIRKSKSEMSRFRVLMGSVKMTDSVTTTVAASGSPRARQESRQDAAGSRECVHRLGCDGPQGRSRRSFL